MNEPRNQNRKIKVIDIDKGRRPTALPLFEMTGDETTDDGAQEADRQADLFTPQLKWIED